jgi:hypothetical protein
MRFLIVPLTMIFLGASSSLGQMRQSEKSRYIAAPIENIVLSVASQPDCPLKIEDAELFISLEGTNPPVYRYRLANHGQKAIRSFTVVAWASNATGGTLSGPALWDGRSTNRLLGPGQSVKSGRDQIEIVPWTREARDKLKVDKFLMVVLLVDHIRFADGSIYDGQSTSKAVLEYFEKSQQ